MTVEKDPTLEELREVCIRAEPLWFNEDRTPEQRLQVTRYWQMASPTVMLALIRYIDALRERIHEQAAHGPVTPATATFIQTLYPQRFDHVAEDPWSLHHALSFASSASPQDPGLTVQDETVDRHESAAAAAADDPTPAPSSEPDAGGLSGATEGSAQPGDAGGDSGGSATNAD